MRTQKSTKKQKQSTFQTIRNVAIAIFLWFALWMSTQYLFIGDLPSWLPDSFQTISNEQLFIYLTVWFCFVGAIGIILWHKLFHNYSFLNPSGKTYLAYIIPIALLIWLLMQPMQFGVRTPIYATGIILTTIWQDLLTFGFLYTYLDTQINSKLAAIITAAVFFTGHLGYDMPLLMLGAYGLAFLFFAYLRYRTRSIYLTNVIHLSFNLLPM